MTMKIKILDPDSPLVKVPLFMRSMDMAEDSIVHLYNDSKKFREAMLEHIHKLITERVKAGTPVDELLKIRSMLTTEDLKIT